MIASIFTFWLLVFGALALLRLRPDAAIARAAFTWLGPVPMRGETRAGFHFRWAAYSFGWLCQIGLVLSILLVASHYFEGIETALWFQASAFALMIGAGMALLAIVGFSAKAVKARVLGPNPVLEVIPKGSDVV